MQIAFRVDASVLIGTGHVMRCLTLAEGLRKRGATCRFISRDHPGNLIGWIRQRDFIVHVLPPERDWKIQEVTPAHASWLGADWQTDAEQTQECLGNLVNDWLVVDHYAINASWELDLAPHYSKLMVIDDLADRIHSCDLLVDQTFGRDAADYLPLVPGACRLLCGSQYALLRPEFASLRRYSLQRRNPPVLRELLITMGGIDKDNATCKVLQALRSCPLPAGCRITVVMGAAAPWLDEVHKQVQDMPWPTRVLVGVSDMAGLMAETDLAIGAAGTSSWERCTLGIPTIMLVLAENQYKVGQGLEQSGGARLIRLDQTLSTHLIELLRSLIDDPAELLYMSECAARIVDGSGLYHVMRQMEL